MPSSVSLNIPAGNGVGSSADTSALDHERTLFVTGNFKGIVTVEASNGSDWCQVASFSGPGIKNISVASSLMRCRVTGLKTGSVDAVEVQAEAGSIDTAVLAVPAAAPNGGSTVGVGTDVSGFGSIITINVNGTFTGVIDVESGDGTNWTTLASFNTPDCKTVRSSAQQLRVRRNTPGFYDVGTVDVECGFSIADAGAGGGGGGGGGVQTVELVESATPGSSYGTSGVDYTPLAPGGAAPTIDWQYGAPGNFAIDFLYAMSVANAGDVTLRLDSLVVADGIDPDSALVAGTPVNFTPGNDTNAHLLQNASFEITAAIGDTVRFSLARPAGDTHPGDFRLIGIRVRAL